MTKTTGNFKDFLTFTRASAATIRDAADGDKVKWPGHNYFTRTDRLGGTSFNTIETLDAAVAPSGEAAAFIAETTANASHWANKGVTLQLGETVKLGALIKLVGRDVVQISTSGNLGGKSLRVNLATGQVLAGAGQVFGLADGWAYLLLEATATASGGHLFYVWSYLDDATASYVGDPAKGFFVGDLRCFRSNLAMVANPDFPADPDFYPTGATPIGLNDRVRGNQPTGTVGKRGLLVEPERTNLIAYTLDVESNGIATLGSVIPTYRNAEGPDGVSDSASTLSVSVDNDGIQIGAGGGVPDGRKFAGSVWLRADVPMSVRLRLLASGAGLGQVTETHAITTEWQRYSVIADWTAITGGDNARFRIQGAEPGTFEFAFPQVEEGSYPTSYIPTNGATATRAGEKAEFPAASFGFSPVVGTFVAEVYGHDMADNRVFDTSYTNGPVMRSSLDIWKGNINGYEATWNTTPGLSDAKIGYNYTPSGMRIAVNGVIDDSATGGSYSLAEPPSDADFYVMYDGSGDQSGGVITSLKYYPRALSDTQLQELTS